MVKVKIQETRKLLMPLETVVDAVLELDRAHGGALSTGKLLEARVEFGVEPGLTLVVQLGTGVATTRVEKHYALTQVAAAAIHYCGRARIPLPRNSTKSIGVGPEGFQLSIELPTEVARLHGGLPDGEQTDAAGTQQASDPADEPWDESEEESAAIEATGDAALDDPTSAEAAEIAA